MSSTRRIEWIDIYKAIGIFLVVVGHVTGKYNIYIYQFHMAAFFVISGYCTDLQKDGIGHYFYKKCYSLYMPVLALTVLGAAMFSILNVTHLYSLLYDTDTYPYLGFSAIVKIFLASYDNYVWWLGAAWFICVLLQVELFHKLLYTVCCRTKRGFCIYAFMAFFLYVFGYYCVKTGICRGRMLDLTFIGQFYFFLGQLARRSNLPEKASRLPWVYVPGVVISFFWLYFCSKQFAATVDFPSRQFGNLFLNMISGIAGSILLWSISGLINKMHVKLKKIFFLMGANTLGILVFHFLALKLIYLALFFMGIVPKTYIWNITPDKKLGDTSWLVISVCAITISTGLWCGLRRIRFFRIVFGDKNFWEEKWDQLKKFVKRNFNYEYKESLKLINDLGDYYSVRKKSIIFSLILVSIMACVYMVNTWIRWNEPLTITFPSQNEKLIKFEEGWQPQGEENYRWICGAGTIELKMREWDSLSVTGYVPEEFVEVSHVNLLINDNVVCEASVLENRSFQLQTDYLEHCTAGENVKITIAFDGVHMHQAGSMDIRDLSGLIDKIEFN